MLQWMGGSRRKVTTSRKSTHKRQKQYFEQRKRQQQQTAGLESYADGKHSYTSHYENNRSLDIQSLVNVATVAQEHKTRTLDARDNSYEDGFALSNQETHHLPVFLFNEGIPEDQSETNEERTSLSYGTEAECSKPAMVHIPDQNEALGGNSNKLDSFKLSNTHPISVIDLLGDGGANNNGEENSRHAQEAHVAFSFEGLGEVGAETPVHSPKIGCRSFPRGFSPLIKPRQTSTSKHLDYDFDDLGYPLVEFSPNKYLIQQPFSTGDVTNIFDDPDQKFLNFRKSSPFNLHGNVLHDDFDNEELIFNIQERAPNFWNVSPNFLDNSIDDLGGGHESFYKSWAGPENVGYDDGYPNKDLWKQEILDGWNVQKKWSSTKTTKRFDMRVPPVTNPRHQVTEDLPDVLISDTKRCSALGIDKDIQDSVNCLLSKDARASLSLLSEESCSSTAVRGDTSKKS